MAFERSGESFASGSTPVEAFRHRSRRSIDVVYYAAVEQKFSSAELLLASA